MPAAVKEVPGALTPWTAINQLLAPDERFERSSSLGVHYLFAPKHPSQMAALLYLLNQQGIKVNFLEMEGCPYSNAPVIISPRAFSELCYHEHGTVEAGAGCTFAGLHQFLFEKKLETAWETAPLCSSKQTIGEILLSGKFSDFEIHQESFIASLLGVEFVTLEGSQVKWGGVHRSGSAGPSLHRLIPGIKSFPGMIQKIYLKTHPIPPCRLRLAWSFRSRKSLWNDFDLLQRFSSSWELLDCLFSGREGEKGFIFAQISGLKDEMDEFSRVCPGYSSAMQKEEREQMKKFMRQQSLKAHASSTDQFLEPGEYLWYHSRNDKGWWLTPKELDLEKASPKLWEQRFLQSLMSV